MKISCSYKLFYIITFLIIVADFLQNLEDVKVYKPIHANIIRGKTESVTKANLF